jgi:tetratricopeptide (TPR) repeat protein
LAFHSPEAQSGNALKALGERQDSPDLPEDELTAYRAALEEYTRDRVPFWWAETENNLGDALEVLGERESGTTRLEEAEAAYRAPLEQLTREEAPIQWARSFGGQGVAMMVIADRVNDLAGVEAALAQFAAAVETERSGGDMHLSEYFLAQLARAHAIRDRLEAQTADCSIAASRTAPRDTVDCRALPPDSEKKP